MKQCEPTIRPATEQDYVAMDQLQTVSVRALCASVYSQELIEAWVGKPKPERYMRGCQKGASYYACMMGERLCGFCAIGLKRRMVEAVFVHPEMAGQGIGSRMLQHLFTLAAQNGIDQLMLESSLNAIDFYASHGFVEYARCQVELMTGQMIDGALMGRKRSADD